jgi:hypothetical protein
LWTFRAASPERSSGYVSLSKGLGVSDAEGRARHIGQINLYRNAAQGQFRLVNHQP